MRNRIYAHRGFWTHMGKAIRHENSLEAFLAAETNGFAIETDIRDFHGGLVVSHDPPVKECIPLEMLLNSSSNLALNIKSDGLSGKLAELSFKNEYFTFDMSFPEQIRYRSEGVKFFTRISEYESQQPGSEGFWVDSFMTDWWANSERLNEFSKTQKKVVFVSPEIHRRPYLNAWNTLLPFFKSNKNFAICTDYPDLFLELL